MGKQIVKRVKRKIRGAAIAVICLFLGLVAVGVKLGEPSRVLDQATQICLSCIGIG